MLYKFLMVLALSGATVAWVASIATHFQKTERKEAMVKLAEAPQAVRDKIAKLLPGVELTEFNVENEDGATVYKGVWKKGTLENEIAVDETGSLIEMETKMAEATVPAAVVAAAKKAFPNGELEFEKKEMVFYEVELTVDGKERELLLSPLGQAIRIETERISDDGVEYESDNE